MKILNIHGYHSEDDYLDGESRNAAYHALSRIGETDVFSLSLDYNAHDADSILTVLRYKFHAHHCDAVVGTSLGGHFAAQVSVEYNCPCILINPCLVPFAYLPKYGYKGSLTGYIRQVAKLAELDKRNVSAILGAQDEVIDMNTTLYILGDKRCTIIPDGGHNGSSLPLKEFLTTALEKAKSGIGGIGESYAVDDDNPTILLTEVDMDKKLQNVCKHKWRRTNYSKKYTKLRCWLCGATRFVRKGS